MGPERAASQSGVSGAAGGPELEVDVTLHRARLIIEAALGLGPEILALVGPSGAGKTSLILAVAGLLRPDRGRIAFGGRPWFDRGAGVDLPPERRSVGVVFQHFALFPHLDVLGNVAYGCASRGAGRGEARRRALEVLRRFGIADLARARPAALSGGERQRVALARAVAAGPEVLLLDEPLSALDPETKAEVSEGLGADLRAVGVPTLLVSHDFTDVVGLADRVAVMEGGRIVQVGTAADLLEAPASPFVASLAGVNYFPGTAVPRDGLTEVRTAEGGILVSTEPASGPVAAVVYPWEVALSTAPPGGSALNRVEGPVRRVAGVGNRVRVTVGGRPEVVAEVTADSAARLGLRPGVRVVASWKATGTRLVPRGAAAGGTAAGPPRSDRGPR